MKIQYSRLHGREAEAKRSVGSCYLIVEVTCFVFENGDSCKIRRSVLFGWEELPWLSRTARLWL